jgi:hypothetical protein
VGKLFTIKRRNSRGSLGKQVKVSGFDTDGVKCSASTDAVVFSISNLTGEENMVL